MKRVLALASLALLLAGGVSYAHEGHHHHDARMMKLHKIMPMYARAQTTIKAALEKGDAETVAKEAGTVLSTAADLKTSRPHKGLSRLPEYRKIAGQFEKDIKKTADSAHKGDLESAKAAFAEAQKRCTSCHVSFRD